MALSFPSSEQPAIELKDLDWRWFCNLQVTWSVRRELTLFRLMKWHTVPRARVGCDCAKERRNWIPGHVKSELVSQ
jgi:hypothetical protein